MTFVDFVDVKARARRRVGSTQRAREKFAIRTVGFQPIKQFIGTSFPGFKQRITSFTLE